jgi:dTDP-4-amino-4,6-dideoxygalactose transaminase
VLEAIEIGPRDLVHVPVGAPEHLERAILTAGARLVAIDLDPVSGAPIWPEDLASSRDTRTMCILDHRFGRPMPPPRTSNGWIVLEDTTGAVGGAVRGRAVGSLGRAAVMVLGAWPFDRTRGALVSTDSADVAARLQAAGLVPLAPEGPTPDGVAVAPWGALEADATDLDDRIDACRAAAGVYDSAFRPLGLPMSVVAPFPETSPTYSTYLVQTQDAGALIHALAQKGVEARRALDTRLSNALEAGPDTAWPGARRFYSRTVALPCHPDLGLDELLYVADAVRVHLQGLPARP